MNFENPGKLENFEKNCWRYHYFRLFFAFYPSPTKPDPENQNIEKMKKKHKTIWRCHHFKLVQQKTQSYDECLLRYGV